MSHSISIYLCLIWYLLRVPLVLFLFFFFFNDTATTEIYTLSLHDALPISRRCGHRSSSRWGRIASAATARSEEHTSELQSLAYLVCRLLLEKKKQQPKLQGPLNGPKGTFRPQPHQMGL